MKYLVRAIKYFFYFSILLILIMAVLILLGVAHGDASTLFRGGYKALWQIALLFGVVAAFYPRFGFTKQKAVITGEYSEIRQGVIAYMEGRGYKLETEDGENLTFRMRSKVNAFFRMMEDRITMTRSAQGFEVEGLTKDVIRVIRGLEYKFHGNDDEQ